MHLPEAFKERMAKMLGAEADLFFASYDAPRTYGLRVNSGRISPEAFAEQFPVPLERISRVPDGFTYGVLSEAELPSAHPWYRAGVYYLQEPSAMLPAALLPVSPGERVLDLCAAPGGKATALGTKLRGKGLLAANDISTSRARALLRNLEMFGITNILVLNESPEQLAERFPAYFDKILVDAPCSGEGMFRKSPEVMAAWSPERVEFFAAQQRNILRCAVKMLRPGGLLLYSTCTFSPQEDEGSVSSILEECPELSLLPLPVEEGFSNGVPAWGNGDVSLKNCLRLWPHKMRGEGHFIALMAKTRREESLFPAAEAKDIPAVERYGKVFRKGKHNRGHTGRAKADRVQHQPPGGAEKELLSAFLEETGVTLPEGRIEVRGGRAYLLPVAMDRPDFPNPAGLHFLRMGLFLGEFLKNRFEPSQSLAMALAAQLEKGQCGNCLQLPADSPLVSKYLAGESFPLPDDGKTRQGRWALVCVDEFPLGWGKISAGMLKNKYPAAWRTES